MYLDKPDLLAAVLPDIVPAGPGIGVPATPTGFVAKATAAMGVSALHIAEPRPGTGVEAGGFWPDLVLIADCPCSQYDALRRTLTAVGPPLRNLACVALSGTGFHGQHRRRWSTAAGNLHLSAIIACDLPAHEYAPILPALPAVAVTEAVATLGQGRVAPAIKWVNDVMLGGQKVAGVLTAVRTHRGRITAVVLGVGLNVEVTPEVPDSAQTTRPTSLRAALPHQAPSLGQTLGTVLVALAQRFVRLQESGPSDLLTAYRERSAVIGRRVVVHPEQGPSREGRVEAIAPDLSLRIQGVAAAVKAGRLTILEPGT